MIEFQCLAYGIHHQQGGICFLISVGTYRILLDCGISNPHSLIADLSHNRSANQKPLDAIFCSHAHLDHCQGLLPIQQSFPDVPIYVSEATAKLLEFHWPNQDLSHFQRSLQALTWRSPTAINAELTLEILPAGHLPGAAACLLTYHPQFPESNLSSSKTEKISLLFTGDLCLSSTRLTDALPIQNYRLLCPDFLLIEGSLGAHKIPNRRQQEYQLLNNIEACWANQSAVAIQCTPLGLSQELILLFKNHPGFANEEVKIWVDLEIQRGCELISSVIHELPTRLQNFARTQSLFLDDRLSPTVQTLDSIKTPLPLPQKSIFLFTKLNSLTRFQTHLDQNLTVFLPSPSDPSHLSLDQASAFHKNTESILQTSPSDYALEIHPYQLENHSDVIGTLFLIHNLKPQHIAFYHGSEEHLAELCSIEELINRYHLHLPKTGKALDVWISSDRLMGIAPSLTEVILEGELDESPQGITIRLPKEITQDSRWEVISDSGMVLATWQGENLLVKGISQRELLSTTKRLKEPHQENCYNCRFYQSHTCTNSASPMHHLTVASDGFCHQFQAISTPSR